MQETITELQSQINKLIIENEKLKLKLSNKKFEYTISEANNEIARATNLLNMWIDKKNNVFEETQPKSAPIDNERVDGSMTREEKFFKYVYKCDKEDIDWWIDRLNEYIVSLNDYLEKELKRINKYDDLLQKIIYYKEVYKPKKNEKITWDWISKKIYCPVATTRRMYSKHKKMRFIDE